MQTSFDACFGFLVVVLEVLCQTDARDDIAVFLHVCRHQRLRIFLFLRPAQTDDRLTDSFIMSQNRAQNFID